MSDEVRRADTVLPLSADKRSEKAEAHQRHPDSDDVVQWCEACGDIWPCDLARYEATVATLEAALREIEALSTADSDLGPLISMRVLRGIGALPAAEG